MADETNLEAASRAHSSNHISYGYFGTATYDSHLKQWEFLRRNNAVPGTIDSIDDFPSPFTVIRRVDRALHIPTVPESSDAAKRFLSSRLLSKSLPDTALSLIYRQHRQTADNKDCSSAPLTPSLLEFGAALLLGSDDDEINKHTYPIAAYVASATPQTLTISLLESEKVSIAENAGPQLRVPRVSNRETTSWLSDSGPILQLCFSTASSSYYGTWLAVRQTAAVSVLRPLLHRTTVSYESGTVLAANQLVKIPSSRTGMLQPAHVDFHPQDPHRLAIVDSGGNWSIWKICGVRTGTMWESYRAQLVVNGSFVSQPDVLQQFDGWHRMMWRSSHGQAIDRLIVANRQSVAVLDLTGAVRYEMDVRVGMRSSGQLLDIQSAASNSDVFVLTESQVFLITTNIIDIADVCSDDIKDPTTLAYWDHFRGSDCNTLRLSTLRCEDDTLLFFIAATEDIITIRRCSRRETENSTHYTISDPYSLILPMQKNTRRDFLTLTAMTSNVKSARHNDGTAIFFQIFFQSPREDVNEVLIRYESHSEISLVLPSIVGSSKKWSMQHKTTSRIVESGYEEDMDDFVVADNISVHDLHFSDAEIEDIAHEHPEWQKVTTRDATALGACDLQRTYNSIAAFISCHRLGDWAMFENLLNDIRISIEDASTARQLSQPVSTSLANFVPVAEVRDLSSALEMWLRGLVSEDFPARKQIREMRFVSQERALTNLYTDLVDAFVSPLADDNMHDHLREQRTRLSRQVALEVFLAGIVIKPLTGVDVEVPDPVPAESSREEVTTSSFPELHSDASPSSPPLPVYERAARRSDQASLLDSYCEYRRPQPGSQQQSSTLLDILAHLPESSDVDPSSYDYKTVERRLALARDEIVAQKMDPRTRRKTEKRARVEQKRLERQEQMKNAVFQQQTSIPSIMSSQLPIRNVQSSQAGPPSLSQLILEGVPQVSMTQPERGIYGKRDTKAVTRKGKARRQKGF